MKITALTTHLIVAPEFSDIPCGTCSPYIRIQLPHMLLWLSGFDRPFDTRDVYPVKLTNQLEEAFKAQVNVIYEQLELF